MISAVVRLRAALHLSLRAPSARVDLPSDKGRLFGAVLGGVGNRRGGARREARASFPQAGTRDRIAQSALV